MKTQLSDECWASVGDILLSLYWFDSSKERGGLLVADNTSSELITVLGIKEFTNEIQTDNFYERSFSEGEFLDLVGIPYNPFKTIVGYWHTHPDGNHTASKIDDYSMFEKANSLNCFFGLWKGRVLSLIISKKGFNLYMYKGKKRYLLKSLNV